MNIITMKDLHLYTKDKFIFNNEEAVKVSVIKKLNNFNNDIIFIKGKYNLVKIDKNKEYFKTMFKNLEIDDNLYIKLSTKELITFINIEENLEYYQVGGSVRDEIIGIKPKDYDYLVINQTPEIMKELNFKQVGNDFPVFLHPITREEFALARKEKSIGIKYTDFKFEINNVTLKDDLSRRDLTINSIAKPISSLALKNSNNSQYIDYFNGINDIKNKMLTHTTEAFKEDPVRIFRIARFLARYEDFKINPKTEKFIINMINDKVHLGITKERIWLETKKALTEKKPSNYFNFLNKVGLLEFMFNKNIDKVKDRINNIDKIKNKIEKKLNKEETVQFLMMYILYDYTFKEIIDINKNFGNLPKNVIKNLKFFKLDNFKKQINSIKDNFKNKNYKDIITFYTNLNNMPLKNLKITYLLNKFTNSKTANKKLINELDFISFYVELNNIPIKKFIENYTKKYNEFPSVDTINKQVYRLKKLKLKKLEIKDFKKQGIKI